MSAMYVLDSSEKCEQKTQSNEKFSDITVVKAGPVTAEHCRRSCSASPKESFCGQRRHLILVVKHSIMSVTKENQINL